MERRGQHPHVTGSEELLVVADRPLSHVSWGAGERRLLRREVESGARRMQLREGRVHLQLHTSAQQEFRSNETPPAHRDVTTATLAVRPCPCAAPKKPRAWLGGKQPWRHREWAWEKLHPRLVTGAGHAWLRCPQCRQP